MKNTVQDLTGTNGVITLKAAPLHSGHIFAITQASTQVEQLYVILSFDQKWLDNLPNSDFWSKHLTKTNRILWLKRTFQDLKHITILCVDETDMGAYPEGVQEWTDQVKNQLKDEHNVESVDKWFSSEPEYTWWIEKYFNCENVIIDAERKEFDISATKIRENPYKHWQYLPTLVRKELLLKVAIIGTESSAKSTLIRYLAKTYNTSWVEEYGRTYCENEMCMDESLLKLDDYGIIASTRYYQEKEAELTANQLLFLDTNAFVTQFYCQLFENDRNQLVDAYIEQENFDLIIHLDDNVEWVSDGLRINSDRSITNTLFDDMLNEYNIKDQNYHFITGNYKQRLDSAMKLVDEMKTTQLNKLK